MKKLRILLAIGSSEIGGGQKVFLTYLRELLRRDCSVVVALPAGPLAELVKAHHIKTYIVNFYSIASVFSVMKILRREPVDIVNTYLTKCSLLFALANVFFRRPFCSTLLNAITHEKLGRLQRMVYPLLYFTLSKLCDGVIVNSEQNKKHLIDTAGINADDIKMIYSGIDLNEFAIHPTQKPKGKKFTIGTVGRLSPEKGHRYLLEALPHLTGMDFECLIVGDGPLRTELEGYAANEKLGNKVKFLGFKTHVAEIMSQMDVVVIPSLNETFGITIIEAFSLRKVVIASDVGGIPELVADKATGFLFPAKNSLALAKAIEYAYHHQTEAEAIANNAYNLVISRFTSAVMTDATLEYYTLLSRKTGLTEVSNGSC